ncbi:MAG TPA: DUF1501 domain-containing protein [Bacteroidetes bacterium]|nr:DUF1501 domain-containing protein [Bacteroidota bacterium]
MKRRDFFKTAAPLGLYPILAGSLPVKTLAATSPFMLGPCDVTDRSLVVIYLNGGNDIINTIVPLNQLSEYANHRPDIRLPESSLITLDGSLPDNQQLGLHPGLSGFKNLYDDGLLNIVQRVGYALPNKSHFKALDNWLTGSGGALQNLQEGLWGRFLKDRYPGYNGNPFLGEPDPLGILFGSMNKTGFHTLQEHSYEINLSGQDPAGFFSLISSLSGEPIMNIPNSEHGDMLRHIAGIENSVNVYAQRISETFNNGTNGSAAYPNSSLGNQLKTIARMLNGGSRTKVFMATTGGFDSHVNEVVGGDTATGNHANLMLNLGNSVKAFQDDLAELGLDGKVTTVIFSEFGRKIIQNDSFGTDHGTLSSMFVIGKGVEGGVTGDNISLDEQDNQGAAHPSQLQNDYRSVLASLMQGWLGAADTSLEATFLSSAVYANMPTLINPNNIVPESCQYEPDDPIVCACVQVKIWLEGLYDPAAQNMRTTLNDNGLLPLQQPYGGAPFFHDGTEAAAALPDGSVDWVLLELRDADDLSNVVARKAVLLQKNGFVAEADGTPGVIFDGVTDGAYHLAVFHRNHLGVVSSEPVLVNAPSFVYDFTQSETTAAGGRQLKQIGSTWCLLAGNADGNALIDNRDFNRWEQSDGQSSVYHPADANADGQVDAADYDLWFENRSKLGELK